MTRSTTAATTHYKERQEQPIAQERPPATVTPLRPDTAKTDRGDATPALVGSEAGLATAEYAIATLAAVGFAALLVAVLSSGEISGMLMSLITNALSFG